MRELTKIPVGQGGKMKRVIETEGSREGRVNQDTLGKRWKKKRVIETEGSREWRVNQDTLGKRWKNEESHRNRRE